MKDPTRIPSLMAELQAVWEAQPNRTLPLIIQQLQAAGMSPASTDADLHELLRDQLATRPHSLSATDLDENAYILETENPARRIVLAHHTVTILPLSGSSAYAARSVARVKKLNSPINSSPLRIRAQGKETPALQPTSWLFSSIRTCRVSQPLVLLDSDGIPHHLGVIASITLADFPAADSDISAGLLPAIRSNRSGTIPWTLNRPTQREDLTNQEWLFRLQDGTLVLLGRWSVAFTLDRRKLSTKARAWANAKLELLTPTPSEDLNKEATTLTVTAPGGQKIISGIVEWGIRVR